MSAGGGGGGYGRGGRGAAILAALKQPVRRPGDTENEQTSGTSSPVVGSAASEVASSASPVMGPSGTPPIQRISPVACEDSSSPPPTQEAPQQLVSTI